MKDCIKAMHKQYSQGKPEAERERETRKVREDTKQRQSVRPRAWKVKHGSVPWLEGAGELETQCGSHISHLIRKLGYL